MISPKHSKAKAPGLRFHITDARSGNTRLRSGEVDLLISMYRNKAQPGQSISSIANLDWAFVAARRLGLPSDPSAETWAGLPHVQVHTGAQGRTPVEDAARLAGVTREVALKVSNFMQALYVASQGKMLFTTFPALIGPIAEKFDLGIYKLPFEMPAAPLSIVTRATKFDPFSLWLHETAKAVIEEALGPRVAGRQSLPPGEM